MIALEHLYILYMEMSTWETKGRKVFKGALPDGLFGPTKIMAANQGWYNGFLATGLIWSLVIGDPVWAKNVALFFLICMAVASIYRAKTANRKIFLCRRYRRS